MAINQLALLGTVLNFPLLAYVLIRWWFIKRFRYVPIENTGQTKSPPVSGAGLPDAGTGGETG